jgi:hypothetical protein
MLVLLWATRRHRRHLCRFGGQYGGQGAPYLLIIVLVMLGCTLVSHFGLQPMMASLRAAAGPGGVMEGAARNEFGILHGISSAIYLVQSLLAAWLVVKQ